MKLLDVCVFLLLNIGLAAAQQSENVCYVLDGILIVYGIVLTMLYCRLKIRSSSQSSYSEQADGDLYQDLGRRDADTYDTLHGMKKKPLA
ncbi:Fc receptor, IgE, high affinity I, gamma polypeptide like [Danio rerio]|uniref:Fc receptor, IgE, high affinity I, gamma polypeptide like n=1 Tax=Danio rerio TaxID=7955 RepID=A7KX12_DANRE|nr:Fc receptor, IgE, high affinity I, gamma polypeptide like precursor [Danio rerio]ABS18392.1 FcRgamma-like protein [Danio rerio]|eukprot:NP_001093626.1 Fc receptor, IgE, high affinity I, gamma polypeptide like precursor [Danio rerio]